MVKVKRFTAAWCGPCKQLSPLFGQLQSEYTNVSFETIPSICLIFRSCSGEIKIDLPNVELSFKSGSIALANERLNSFNPLNTDSTTKRASAPMIIPTLAIRLIMLIALFLLVLLLYRLAM